MTKPIFLDSLLQEVTAEIFINVIMFSGDLLMNTNKEHLIKVYLVSSEVGPFCQDTQTYPELYHVLCIIF